MLNLGLVAPRYWYLSCAVLSVVGAIIFACLSFEGNLNISQGIVLDDEYFIADPLAMTGIGGDVYVIAGQSRIGEVALGFRLPRNASKAELLWRYTSERSKQLVDANRDRPFGGPAFAPAFHGVAPMSDGDVLLCGYGPAGVRGSDRPGQLTQLDSSGRVISEKMLLPPKFADPPLKPDPGSLGSVVSADFDACLPWGDKVGIIGRVAHSVPSEVDPRTRTRTTYNWIVVVDAAGEVVWQRVFKAASGSADFTSSVVTPGHNLLFTYWTSDQTEILLVGPTGNLIGASQLDGFYLAVNPMATPRAIQIFGGKYRESKNLITFDETLQEIHRERDLHITEFVAKKAYGFADSSLVLLGEQSQGMDYLSAVRHVSASRQVTAKRLTHGSLSDQGTAKVSTLATRAGELLIARSQFERTSDGSVKRQGIALDLIDASRN